MAKADDGNPDDPIPSYFRTLGFFEAARRTFLHLQRGAHDEQSLVNAGLRALDEHAHARPPSRSQVTRFQSPLLIAEPLALLVYVYAVRRWFSRTPLREKAMTIVMAPFILAKADFRKASPALMATLNQLVPLLAEPFRDAEVERLRHVDRHQVAIAFVESEDPVEALRGRRLLERCVLDLRAAVEREPDREHRSQLRGVLAQAIANLGNATTTFAFSPGCGDRRATLERALALHEEAMSYPERMADPREPVGRFHSIRMRGTCRRYLARELEGPEHAARRRELREGAIADADAAMSAAAEHPDVARADGGGIILNAVNARMDLLRERAAEGASLEEVQEGLRAVEALVARLDGATSSQVHLHRPHVEATVRALRAKIEGRQQATGEADLLRHIGAALASISESRTRSASRDLAAIALHAADEWRNGPLPVAAWKGLAGLLAHLTPEIAGVNLVRHAMLSECRLLLLEDGTRREDFDPLRYVEDAVTGICSRLRDPTLSVADRRAYAGWVRHLSEVRLAWAGRRGEVIDALEVLRWVDLLGSVAWRSDLGFYGAGAVQPASSEPWALSEARWRCHLYRTRIEIDDASNIIQFADLLEEHLPDGRRGIDESLLRMHSLRARIFPPGTDPRRIQLETGVDPSLWSRSRDGIVVPLTQTPEEAEESRLELSSELRTILGVGAANGWLPSGSTALPLVEVTGLAEWLVAKPGTAILAGTQELVMAGAHEGSSWSERVDLREASTFGRALEEYFAARNTHSYGWDQDVDSAVALSEDEALRGAPSREYAYRVATPAATRRLRDALDGLVEALGAALSAALETAASRGVERIVILNREWLRHVPWQAVTFRGQPLGASFEVATVETLAEVPRADPRRGPCVTYVGGRPSERSTLSLGRALLGPVSDRVEGPLSRDEFDLLAARAGVLRVYAHGESLVGNNDANGIILDEEDPRSFNRYGVSEIRALDLRGARRVELWACESGREDDPLGALLHHDEPGGADTAALTAGAECALTSLWIQYSLSAAMIAEAFALELRAAPSAGECRALGRAIARYRQAMASGGVFEQGARTRLVETGGRVSLESALEAGLAAWRQRLWRELAGGEPPALGLAGMAGLQSLGPVGSARDSIARGDSAALDSWLDEVLEPYRSIVAWGGWKLTFRSRGVLRPREE